MNHKILSLIIMGVLVVGISQAYATNEIIFDVNKTNYGPGEVVELHGIVKGQSNQQVAVEVKDPAGNTIVIRTVQTDDNGNFVLKFKLPSTAKAGNYNIVTNTVIGNKTITQSKQITQNTTVAQTTNQAQVKPVSQTTNATKPSRCLIATAAFGSDLSPQVQFLRGVRDNNIMSTMSGASFMTAFNGVYYSFSPSVADAERQNPYLRDTIKTGIYPLLGILEVSQISQVVKSEYSVIGAGVLVSTLLGATYLWPAGLAVKSVRKGIRPNLKLTLGVVAVSVIAVLSSLASSNPTALMISSSILVLSLAGVSSLYTSWGIVKLVQRIRN